MTIQDMDRKQQIRHECELKALEACKLIGFACWYEQPKEVLTEQEKGEILALWNDMPGSTSWTHAFLRWMQQGETP